ncbi:MAG TPA: tetratricopeptide repeat protein, partial [Vicinamibacterales bacterium]|nr:tetratricopeptide repeat protein [Vicinamibacterales bacterium]
RAATRFSLPVAAGALALVLVLVAGAWWYGRRSTPTASTTSHAPVSVLVADFQNQTGDPLFDGLVAQALTIGVEGASFVTAYPRRDAIRLAAALTPDKVLDAKAASLIALREGINVVVDGSISRQGSDYRLDLQALDPANGRTLLAWNTTAAGRDQVLPAVGRAAARVRRALGDAGAGDDAQVAGETFTAGSLQAAHEYVTAQELNWKGDFDGAVQHYKQAIADDPDMGRAYAGLAALYANLGRHDEADAEYKIALSKLDRMTERERYRTRGGYYLLTRNTDRAIDEFESLVKQYPADTAGLANLALAYFYRRDMKRALADGRRAMQIYPKNVVNSDNVALYAMYAGDFTTAEGEAAEVLKLNPKYVKAYVATGLSQLAEGQTDKAAATYRTLDALSPAGHIFASYGLVDLAIYDGRLDDAAKEAQQALATPNLPTSVAARLEATLAEIRTMQGRSAAAVEAADRAATSSDEGVLFLAGRAYLAAGRDTKVQAIVRALDGRLATEPQIYGHLLEGEIALRAGNAREALAAFQAAQKLADTWLGRFDMARAYLSAGAFTEASSELDRCTARKGEATAVFLDDIPSFHLFAPVAYYRGRIQEGLKSPDAAASYKAFLAIKAHGDQQQLVADARQRLAALSAR